MPKFFLLWAREGGSSVVVGTPSVMCDSVVTAAFVGYLYLIDLYWLSL